MIELPGTLPIAFGNLRAEVRPAEGGGVIVMMHNYVTMSTSGFAGNSPTRLSCIEFERLRWSLRRGCEGDGGLSRSDRWRAHDRRCWSGR